MGLRFGCNLCATPPTQPDRIARQVVVTAGRPIVQEAERSHRIVGYAVAAVLAALGHLGGNGAVQAVHLLRCDADQRPVKPRG